MPHHVPDGYHTLVPHLICADAAAALDFYVAAFGAVELFRMPQPDGRIGHAEIQCGDSRLMLASEFPEMNAHAPGHFGGSPASMMLYVPDVDAVFARAIALGATEIFPVQNKFYGDRTGTLRDPAGHKWSIATHIEDVPPEEMEARAKAAGQG